MFNKKKIFINSARVIIILLLILFFYKLDFDKLKDCLFKIKIKYLILAISVTFLAEFFRAYKQKLYLELYDIKTDYSNVLVSEYIGACIGLMTPGRFGEFIKISYYKILNGKKNIPKLFLIFFSIRIIDIIFIFIIAALSAYLLFHQVKYIRYLLILIFTLSALILSINKMKKIIKKVIFESLYLKIIKVYSLFRNTLQKKNIKVFIMFFIILLIYWGFVFYVRKVLFLSMGINFDYFYVIKVVSIILISSIVPVGPVGTGSRDLAVVIVFKYLGLSIEMALLYSVLIFISDGIYMMGGLILSLFIKP